MRNYRNIGALFAIVLVATGCVGVPLDVPKEATTALTNTGEGREAQKVDVWLDGRDDVNGFYPLTQGFDAFGTRLLLMDVAEYSIDAQYFLMKPDYAGLVFADRLLDAADRGMRVRLLLDDVFTTVEDIDLAMLNDHENIEVRIFNPIARKGIYAFNYLGHFSMANRRMHNKSFTIDNQISVVGGRNIAAEYYQLETTGEFIDFDMIAVGPVVKNISAEFDRYWNHELAIPMEQLFQEKDKEKLATARDSMQKEMAEAGQSIYAEAINTEVLQKLSAQQYEPYIANARLLTDDPDKLLQDVSADTQIVVNEMREVLLDAESEIIIITPYFVPRKKGIELVQELREKGIRVIILTNGLATNNHTSVHSAYATYRKDLLRAGVELWEVRADAAKITLPDGESQLDQLTLHTKGLLVDSRHVFVGSLNLDPRSIDINTEMGLLIESKELGGSLRNLVKQRIPRIAYQLKLDGNGKITWHATLDGKEVVETKEPQTTAWKRFTAWFLKIAPEKQL